MRLNSKAKITTASLLARTLPFDTAGLRVTLRTCVSPGLHAWQVLGALGSWHLEGKFVGRFGSLSSTSRIILLHVQDTTDSWLLTLVVKATGMPKLGCANHKLCQKSSLASSAHPRNGS